MPGPTYKESLHDKENTPIPKRLTRKAAGNLSVYEFEYDENDSAEKKINKRKYKKRNVLKSKNNFQPPNKKKTKATTSRTTKNAVVEYKISSNDQLRNNVKFPNKKKTTIATNQKFKNTTDQFESKISNDIPNTDLQSNKKKSMAMASPTKGFEESMISSKLEPKNKLQSLRQSVAPASTTQTAENTKFESCSNSTSFEVSIPISADMCQTSALKIQTPVAGTGNDETMKSNISYNEQYFGFGNDCFNSTPSVIELVNTTLIRGDEIPRENNLSLSIHQVESVPTTTGIGAVEELSISSNEEYFGFSDHSSNSSPVREVINNALPELDRSIPALVYTSSPMANSVFQTPMVNKNLSIHQIQAMLDESIPNPTDSESSIFLDSEMSESTSYFPNSDMISLPDTSTVNETVSNIPDSTIHEIKEQRRSYGNLRPRKIIHFVEPYESLWSDDDEQTTKEETTSKVKSKKRNNKNKRKQNVAFKKEEEFLKLAESLNSKFKQIEQFQLAVE